MLFFFFKTVGAAIKALCRPRDAMHANDASSTAKDREIKSARVRPVRDIIASSSDTLSQCVVECERDNDCFAVQVAPACMQLVLPTVSF